MSQQLYSVLVNKLGGTKLTKSHSSYGGWSPNNVRYIVLSIEGVGVVYHTGTTKVDVTRLDPINTLAEVVQGKFKNPFDAFFHKKFGCLEAIFIDEDLTPYLEPLTDRFITEYRQENYRFYLLQGVPSHTALSMFMGDESVIKQALKVKSPKEVRLVKPWKTITPLVPGVYEMDKGILKEHFESLKNQHGVTGSGDESEEYINELQEKLLVGIKYEVRSRVLYAYSKALCRLLDSRGITLQVEGHTRGYSEISKMGSEQAQKAVEFYENSRLVAHAIDGQKYSPYRAKVEEIGVTGVKANNLLNNTPLLAHRQWQWQFYPTVRGKGGASNAVWVHLLSTGMFTLGSLQGGNGFPYWEEIDIALDLTENTDIYSEAPGLLIWLICKYAGTAPYGGVSQWVQGTPGNLTIGGIKYNEHPLVRGSKRDRDEKKVVEPETKPKRPATTNTNTNTNTKGGILDGLKSIFKL